MEKNIYKEAILDAKAVRASAIANAKAALQEAIEPKIQEMMRLKLSEELEENLDEELEEGTYEEGTYEESVNEEGEITEASLDEILAELDAMEEGSGKDHETMEEGEIEEGDESVEEAAKKDEEDEDEDEEETEAPEGEMAGEEAAVEDDTKVIDLTLGDLKSVLQSVMGQAPMGDEEPLDADAATEMGMGGEEGEADSDISLDEILAELEKEGYEKQEEAKDPGYVHGKQTPEIEEAAKEEDSKKIEEMEKELEEAKETIATLRESINDINLLNAKLLYMNKIFKAKSLSESQKIKVIKAFDRSTSVKEVKNTYETLKESFGAKKETIKESVGFASKPIGNAPKTPIVESNDFVSRWQKIAGIK